MLVELDLVLSILKKRRDAYHSCGRYSQGVCLKEAMDEIEMLGRGGNGPNEDKGVLPFNGKTG